MHRHLKSIATWWEGVFSRDSRVFLPPNPPKAKLEFSTSMLTPTLPITPFKSTCTCWQSPDLDMVLVLIPDLYPESDLLLGPTTWCDYMTETLMDIVLDPKNPLRLRVCWVKRLYLGLICYAFCHVTRPMLCNQHKYLKTCVHPSLITVLSATIEVNVTQVFVIIKIYISCCCTVCTCKNPIFLSLYPEIITRFGVVGQIQVNITMEADQGKWVEIYK